MNRRLRAQALVVALVLGGLVVVPSEAAAQIGAEKVENPVVEVYVEGEGPEIEDAVARGVARVGSAVDYVRAPREPRLGGDRFARVDVRITTTEVTVAIVFARGGAANRAVPRSATKAVESEEVALVVESALESELDAIREKPIPPPPAPAPPPKNPEAPKALPVVVRPSPEGATLVLFGGVLGGIGGYAEREGVVGRLGGELGVASSGRLRPSVAMRAFYTLPFDGGSPRASADASVVNLRVVPAVQLVELTGIAFGLGAALGVDILSVSARSDVPNAKVEPVSVRADPIVSPMVLTRIAIAKNVSLSASFALDLSLAPRVFYADDGGTRTPLLEPMRARPLGLVGVDFALFGDDRAGRAEGAR